jgi:hypothetical protein
MNFSLKLLCTDHAENTASLLFTAPLHSNGSYSSVVCVFDAVGMCLPSRCLAVNVYSDFAIPAFGHHVTIHSFPSAGTTYNNVCVVTVAGQRLNSSPNR